MPLETRNVEIARTPGLGLEATARRARYGAIEDMLGEGEILALAHHRDDQAETVLLKLLRGAGPEGLGAMRTLRRLGRGFAWRPLLALPRATLRGYAERHRLIWIEDPSNADVSLDRNLLRIEILPRIMRRWPEAEASIAQSAIWARAAADFIDEEAERALARLQGLDPATLRFREWLALPDALRDPVLRRWLRSIGLPEPTQFQVAELVRQLAEAGEDRQPCVRWPGVEVRGVIASCCTRCRRCICRRSTGARTSPARRSCCLRMRVPLQLVALATDAPPPAAGRSRHRALPSRRRKPAAFRRFAFARPARSSCRKPACRRTAAQPAAAGVRCGRRAAAIGDLWISEAGAELFARAGARLRLAQEVLP